MQFGGLRNRIGGFQAEKTCPVCPDHRIHDGDPWQKMGLPIGLRIPSAGEWSYHHVNQQLLRGCGM